MEIVKEGGWDAILSIATVIAILVGPILAVLATRLVDDRRSHHFRRWEIFRTLMRARRSQTSQDFVGALNLVEVEFSKNARVVARAKDFIQLFNSKPPQDDAGWRQLEVDRDTRLARLLDAMGQSLGVSMEQVDIMTGGYAPQVWGNVEYEKQLIRRGLIRVLSGQGALPVEIQPPSESPSAPASLPYDSRKETNN